MEAKFKVYDYKTALDILKNACDKKGAQGLYPTMVIVAGPNASGKSTYIANLYADNDCSYPYINADIINKFELEHIKNEEERNLKGMHLAMQRVEEAINNKTSFVYETVLSHPSKLELVKKAKQKGFVIKTVFIYTSDPEINIRRLKTRVLSGGHDVPSEKVIKRYYRSIENKQKLIEMSDIAVEFDNSKDRNTERIK